jgi:peptide-methionine (S)-S-oxide reductase
MSDVNEAVNELAYFATGCFWGAERRYWQIPGVIKTTVGYMGGRRENPTYEQVCAGATGHTETVEVLFDPKVVSYHRLLVEFWTMHDPTSLNRQGNDIGTQYRSAIFTTSQSQVEEAHATKGLYQQALSEMGVGEIVTEISDASDHPYWIAEEYHQRYLEKNPNGYDCHSSAGVAFPVTQSI